MKPKRRFNPMVPVTAMLADSRLNHRSLRVLLALYQFADQSGACKPSREKLAQLARVHENKVSEITSELARLGWLHKTGNGGRSCTARYVITVPPHLLDDETLPDSGTVYGAETLPNLGTVYGAETLPDSGTVYGAETLPDSGTVTQTIPVAGTVSETETLPNSAETLPNLGGKTLPDLGRGKEHTKNTPEEQTRGTRAREARAAPPPPQKGEGLPERGGSGAGAPVAEGNAPSPLPSAPVSASRSGGEGMNAPPTTQPLTPAAQRAALAAALAADAAKRHPLCPPEVEAQVFNDWLAMRKEHHAPVNATVVRVAREEADRAGMSLSRFLEQWCLAGSKRFSADWLIADRQRAGEKKKGVEPMRDENGEVLFFEDIMRRRAQRRAEEAKRLRQEQQQQQQERRNAL